MARSTRRRQDLRRADDAAVSRRGRRSRLAGAGPRRARRGPRDLAGSSRPRAPGRTGRRSHHRRATARRRRDGAEVGPLLRDARRRPPRAERAAHAWASATAARRRSSPAPDGAIFAAWRHVYAGNLRDIAFGASRDGGAHVRRAGAGERRTAGRSTAAPTTGPAMAVDADRHVPHRVADGRSAGDDAEGRAVLRVARATDGRFAPRVRIPTLGSPKPSHPQMAIDATGRLVRRLGRDPRRRAHRRLQRRRSIRRHGAIRRSRAPAPGPGPRGTR